MKKTVMKQIKEMTGNFKPDKLAPCEAASFNFKPSPKVAQACQEFGEVYVRIVSQEKCYATGKGLELAKVGKPATVVIHIVDDKGEAYTVPTEMIMCEFVSVANDKMTKCSIKAKQAGQYEVIYQATSRGRHQLHIKVEGEHIKGSPFTVISVQKLGTPIKTISGVKGPWGVAINQRGEIIVAEESGHCISIFSPAGDKFQSFGSKGTGNGHFNCPRSVAVDDDGNILVADSGNNRIQKFTSAGKLIKAAGKGGNKLLEFSDPFGIAIHKNVYVSEVYNQRIQILNAGLTFSSSFGSEGRENGQFSYPWDVACDSTGKVYVADSNNHCIQVFTAKGQFLRKFGKKGSGNGELNWPASINIDSEDVVYVVEEENHRISVFTCEGKFLTSFGSKGSGPGQFRYPRGIAVDKNGVVYVSECGNNRLQLF